ncbi:MAG: DUF4416 family protein [Anaerolineae bacterium]|nr:DUF4416 family protein [Anaerolineae bacterium]
MGQAKPPNPVKLIVSAFAPHDGLLQDVKTALVDRWGAIDYQSELLPFAHTAYYAPEFGADLVRRIWAFEPLVDPATLVQIKGQTNNLERQWSVEDRRQVNLDPGYVSMAKLVLATTKNHGHRVYLGDGIYAEVTLHYRDGAFRPWPWTYPDYASPRYCALFDEIRRRYVTQLRHSTRE